VQYFQRARFEYHEKNKAPYDVLLGLLGNEQLLARYPKGNFPPTLEIGTEQPCQVFDQTGYKICGRFLEYWRANGGLSQFGFPVSPLLQEQNDPPPAGDGKTHPVQYFERARFELHPENNAPFDVLLGLLGVEQYKARYGAIPPAGTPLKTIFPELAALENTTTEMRLKDDWTGLSDIAPQVAHFWLERQGEAFQGEALFHLGGYSGHEMETTRQLNIPLAQTQKFLQMLADLPVREGQYQPTIDHTDDYPHLEFVLETTSGPLVIGSSSQGLRYVPWGAFYQGKKEHCCNEGSVLLF
jgi:hypothetical protein